jgi:HD-like signal output (HDOD) protein
MSSNTASSTADLEDLIDGTVNIPTIPTVLTEITAVFHSPEGSARDAANVIKKDGATATRVLRLVNSSFYGLKNPVSNIDLACSILGLKVLKNLVVQATVLQTFQAVPAVAGFDTAWLWDHAFKTAVACRLLAERTTVGNGMAKDDAYTCGLIHDIGKLILIQAQTERFGKALQVSTSAGIPLARAEAEVFGFQHAHVGGLLAKRWKLAENVQAAVLHHHAAASDADAYGRGFLVRAANGLAHVAAGDRNGGYRGERCDDAELQRLGLDAEQLQDIIAHAARASMQS